MLESGVVTLSSFFEVGIGSGTDEVIGHHQRLDAIKGTDRVIHSVDGCKVEIGVSTSVWKEKPVLSGKAFNIVRAQRASIVENEEALASELTQ